MNTLYLSFDFGDYFPTIAVLDHLELALMFLVRVFNKGKIDEIKNLFNISYIDLYV